MRGKKAAQPSPTQNPRPAQHRRKEKNPPSLVALKVADTPLSVAFRHIQPTWRNYIYYVGVAADAGDEEMKKFIKHYDALPPRERNAVTPEKVCELSGVAPRSLVASVSGEFWAHKQGESTITASALHPKIIEHTAWAAAFLDNTRDRELFFRLTGTLPDKKGASIVINNTPQNANVNLPAHAGSGLFKSMDQSVVEMSKLLDEPLDVNAVPLPQEEYIPQIDDEEAELVFAEADSSED